MSGIDFYFQHLNLISERTLTYEYSLPVDLSRLLSRLFASPLAWASHTDMHRNVTVYDVYIKGYMLYKQTLSRGVSSKESACAYSRHSQHRSACKSDLHRMRMRCPLGSKSERLKVHVSMICLCMCALMPIFLCGSVHFCTRICVGECLFMCVLM